MIALLIIYVCLSALSFALILYLMHKAPEGYEDGKGFHLGKPERNNKVIYECKVKYNTGSIITVKLKASNISRCKQTLKEMLKNTGDYEIVYITPFKFDEEVINDILRGRI